MSKLTQTEKSHAILSLTKSLEALYDDAITTTPNLYKLEASWSKAGLDFWAWVDTPNGRFSGYSPNLLGAINMAVEKADAAIETVESKRRKAAKLLAEAEEMEAAANTNTTTTT